jgi:hypothetical protein
MKTIAYLFKFTSDIIDNIDIKHTSKRREKDKNPFFFFHWTPKLEAGMATIGRGLKNVITTIVRVFSLNAIRLFQILFLMCILIAIIPQSFYLSNSFEFWHKFEGRILASQDKNLGYHYLPKKHLEKAVAVLATPMITVSPKYYIVNKANKGVTIRKTPDLNGKKLGSVGKDEPLKYLDEEQTDLQGIKWYKIEAKNTKNHIIGWVSSRIVEESK